MMPVKREARNRSRLSSKCGRRAATCAACGRGVTNLSDVASRCGAAFASRRYWARSCWAQPWCRAASSAVAVANLSGKAYRCGAAFARRSHWIRSRWANAWCRAAAFASAIAYLAYGASHRKSAAITRCVHWIRARWTSGRCCRTGSSAGAIADLSDGACR